MTAQVTERLCMWSEADAEGVHSLCTEPAFFSVPIAYPTDHGLKADRVNLCTTHALQVQKEGIAKR